MNVASGFSPFQATFHSAALAPSLNVAAPLGSSRAGFVGGGPSGGGVYAAEPTSSSSGHALSPTAIAAIVGVLVVGGVIVYRMRKRR